MSIGVLNWGGASLIGVIHGTPFPLLTAVLYKGHEGHIAQVATGSAESGAGSQGGVAEDGAQHGGGGDNKGVKKRQRGAQQKEGQLGRNKRGEKSKKQVRWKDQEVGARAGEREGGGGEGAKVPMGPEQLQR